ncbi:MAG: FAD-dependent oxidoreductase [Candidatus Babeliales bacterium]
MKHSKRIISMIFLCIGVVILSAAPKSYKNTDIYDVVVIGSGIAGLTAGMQAARAQLKTLVIEGPFAGGSLISVPKITNWPGELEITGYQLIQKLHDHAAHFGCSFLEETIKKVALSKQPFIITTKNDTSIQTRSIIIATGAQPKRLKIPGENEYWGKGIAVCSRCDGPLFYGKNVAVIGSGNTAMHEAINMLKFTNKITLIVPGATLVGSEKMRKRVMENSKITILYNTIVQKIQGDSDVVTHLMLKDKTTGIQSEFPVEGVFVAIGMHPSSDIFKEQLLCDNKGYILVTDKTNTSKEGVFACGVVCDSCYQQAASCAGTGCMAAVDAERYLNKLSSSIA